MDEKVITEMIKILGDKMETMSKVQSDLTQSLDKFVGKIDEYTGVLLNAAVGKVPDKHIGVDTHLKIVWSVIAAFSVIIGIKEAVSYIQG